MLRSNLFDPSEDTKSDGKVFYEGPLLFNLESDSFEQANVADKVPSELARLSDILGGMLPVESLSHGVL